MENERAERLPKVSVVTVNTNEKHRLLVCLPSVFESRGDFEFIISDNGSTDGSIEYLRSQFPQVRIIENGRNLGFAAANNRAAKEARGEIIVFLNPDTRVEPQWLETLIEPFADPGVGLTTSRLLLLQHPEMLNTCGNEMHVSGFTLCRGMGQPAGSFPRQEEVAAVSGAAFAMRREVFEELHGFDEDFFIYMEETDLSLRARIAGWKCIYVPASVVYHDYQFKVGPKKVFYQERNRYLMLLGNLRTPTLVVLLPALLLAEIISWGFVVLRDRKNWANKLKAYTWVATNGQWIRRRRQQMRNLRATTDRSVWQVTGYRIDYGQAASGRIVWIGRNLIDPVFAILRRLSLALIWW